MDYRSRWQQKRRERATRQRLVLIAAVLVIAAGVVVSLRGISRAAPSGGFQLPGPVVSWLSASEDGVLITTRNGELLKLTPDLEPVEEGWARPFTHPAGFWGRAAVLGRNAIVGSEDVRARAINLASGVQNWELAVGGAVSGITTEGEHVYFTSAEPALYCATAEGALVWRTALAARVSSPPLVTLDTVVVGTLHGVICAYERASGATLWCVKPELPAAIHARPSMGPSSILVGDDRGRLHSITRSGEMLTSMEFEGLIRQPVAVRDAVVVAGDSSGLLRRVDPSDMTERWQARLPGPLAAEPIIVDGVIWCGAGRRLVALDAEDGSTITRRTADAQTSDVLVAHGRIYWATTDGRIGFVTIEQ